MTDTFLDQAGTDYERVCRADARANPPVKVGQTVAIYRNTLDGRSIGYGRVLAPLCWSEDQKTWYAQVELAPTRKIKTISTTLLEPAQFQKSQMAHWFKVLNRVGEGLTAVCLAFAPAWVPWAYYLHTGRYLQF